MAPPLARKPSRIYAGNEPAGPIHPLLSVALLISLVATISALEFFAQLASEGQRSFDSTPFLALQENASTWLIVAFACCCSVIVHVWWRGHRHSGVGPAWCAACGSLYCWWLLRWMHLEAGVSGYSSNGVPVALGVCLLWSALGTTFLYFMFERVIRVNGLQRNGLHVAALFCAASVLFFVSMRFARTSLAPDREAREAAYSALSDSLPPLSRTGRWLAVRGAAECLLFTAGPAAQGGELHACVAWARGDFHAVADGGFEGFALLDCVTLVMFEMPEALERIHEGDRRRARDGYEPGYRPGEYLLPWLRFERPELAFCELPADTSVDYLHAAARVAREHVRARTGSASACCRARAPRA